MNTLLLIGSLLGFISVLMGASGDHLFILNDDKAEVLATAVRYNMIYAVLITGMGLLKCMPLPTKLAKGLTRSGLLFSIGTVAFVFSLYLNLLTDIPWLVYFTPFGGLTLMISWLSLAILAIQHAKHREKTKSEP